MLQRIDCQNGGDWEIRLWRAVWICTWLVKWVNQNFLVAGKELRDLRRELASSKQAAFVVGMSRTCWFSGRVFLLFCLYFKFEPSPASDESVCLFAQFLSQTFEAVSSIQNHISGLRTLHALLELPFTAAGSIDLKQTLKAFKKIETA